MTLNAVIPLFFIAAVEAQLRGDDKNGLSALVDAIAAVQYDFFAD